MHAPERSITHGGSHFPVGADHRFRQVTDVRDRQARPAIARCGDRPDRQHPRPRHGQRGQGRPGRHRLLPAHRRRRGAHVRRRTDPRLVLPAGGAAVRRRHPQRPAHRPHPAAVCSPTGSATRPRSSSTSSAPTSRTRPTSSASTPPRLRSCSRASRSTARSAPSVWPTRPRASGCRTRPSARATRRTFEMVVTGRETDERRHRHHDGRGRRHRERLGHLRERCAQGHRGEPSPPASRRPRRGSRSRSTCSTSWSSRSGRRDPLRWDPVLDYGDELLRPGRRGRSASVWPRPVRSASSPSAMRPSTTATSELLTRAVG